LIIELNLSSSYPSHIGKDVKKIRGLSTSGQRPCDGKGAALELCTGRSTQQWREGVERGSTVVDIDVGGR